MERAVIEQDLIERMKDSGLRLTPQRLAVYRALAATDRHPTAQALYEQVRQQIPSLSQATVYNNLQVLVRHGLVQELGDLGDGAVHYDADLTPHLNLVCTHCGRIEDFYDPALVEMDAVVSGRSGYTLRGARLVYYGLCPACKESAT